MASPDPTSVLDLALMLGEVFTELGIRYFVGGSVASSIDGEPRATNDIDIVVAMTPDEVDVFADRLGADFEVDREMLQDAIRRGSCANLFYLPFVTKIDIFALGSHEYDHVEFSRRRPIVVREGRAPLWVKAPEDTVLRKLLWYREGGGVSTKQWRDVVEVLRVCEPSLDTEYLEDWSVRVEVGALLERARREAGT